MTPQTEAGKALHAEFPEWGVGRDGNTHRIGPLWGERIAKIEAQARKQVIDICHAALPATDAYEIEDRLNEALR
jgi:hypothetical protein